MRREVKKEDLLFSEESYKICGALFDVFKELGSGHREKVYQSASEKALENKGFVVQREVSVPVFFQGMNVGRYRLDFLINNQIIVELKAGELTSKKYIEQVVGYLRALDLQLCILAQFTSKGVRTRRILNIDQPNKE